MSRGTLRVICVQHVAFEGPAYLADWARRRGHRLAIRQAWRSRFTDRPKALILLGGPMSVYDEARYPWLVREKRWLEDCLADGVPVLGICLGAQLLAEAVGGRVHPGPEREIGWYPVRPTSEAEERNPGFDDAFMPLHWHGDTFELPPEAMPLAASDCYHNQAFDWEGQALGLQFHLEATPRWLARLSEATDDAGKPGRWVQTPASMLQPGPHWAAAHARLTAMLDALFEMHAGP